MNYLTEAAAGSKKRKATRLFVLFLVFMLACTIISRGIYAWQMPQVETGVAEQKTLAHTVFASGMVEGVRETAVLTETGVRVEEICVKPGDVVEKGTLLLRLSVQDLEELDEEVEAQLTVAREALSDARKSRQTADKAAKTARQRARDDLARTKKTQNKAVSNAEDAYANAKKQLNNFPSWKEYRDMAREKDSQYKKLQKAAEKKDATKEDKTALKEYRQTLDAASRTAWETKKQALKDAVADTKGALQSAKSSREEALLAAKRVVEDASDIPDASDSGETELEQQIRQLDRMRKTYGELIDRKGEITSDIEGAVDRILLSVGDRTMDSAAMILTDSEGGWNFRAALSEEATEYLAEGDTVTVTLQGGQVTDAAAVITAITYSEEGYEALVRLNVTNVSPGTAGTLSVTRQSGPYTCCVPLSALYADNNRSYVLLLRETPTILGTELRLIRRDVSIEDKNENYAALADGTLGAEDRIVVLSSKALIPGDTVRLMETAYE